MLKMAPKISKSSSDALANEDISFDLERLFDPYNMDHIPVEQRLDKFRKRDLPYIKHYKAAVNIFGGPVSRKRIIIAPPMETPLKHKLGLYLNQRTFPLAPALNTQPCLGKLTSNSLMTEKETHKGILKEESDYKNWFEERQALRNNLNKMGLNEGLLSRKKDKTELESRVEAQLRTARKWRPEQPPSPEPTPEIKELPVVPNVKVPVPSALQTLDRFLVRNKLRLIDLFAHADRNKDWRLNKVELQNAIKQFNIPLSTTDVEDLMVVLDRDFDEQLDFKEVSHGLGVLRMERRALKRHGQEIRENQSSPVLSLSRISPISSVKALNSNQNSHLETSTFTKGWHQHFSDGDQVTAETVGEVEVQEPVDIPRKTSSWGSATSLQNIPLSRPQSSSSNTLEVPPVDLREECRVAASEEEMLELRKHDKVVLERARTSKWPMTDKKGQHDELPGVIRIGLKTVDSHCQESTLVGETGSHMDRFRRNALREYFQAVKICQEKGVILTPELLDHVLLYPPEIPHSELVKHLRIPSGPLSDLPEDFAKSALALSSSKTLQGVQRKVLVKRSKNGEIIIDTRHLYPPLSKVASFPSKMNLSTGPAMVSRKSDCWMSFEEYEKHSKDLLARYTLLHGDREMLSDENGNQTKDLQKQSKFNSESAGLRRQLSTLGRASSELSRESAPISRGTAKLGKRSARVAQDSSKFWPGYMLHKLALWMPKEQHEAKGGNAVFHHTRQPRRAYPFYTKHLENQVTAPGIDLRRQLTPPHRRRRLAYRN